MGCWQCLPLSVVQLKGKHCRKSHCRNRVVDTFGQSMLQADDYTIFDSRNNQMYQLSKSQTQTPAEPTETFRKLFAI